MTKAVERRLVLVTTVIRIGRAIATFGMCGSALVLAVALLSWPATGNAQVADSVAIARAAGELAEKLPLDVTRLALQVAIVSMLVNAALILAFYRVVSKFGEKPCIMSGEAGKAVVESWMARALRVAVEKRES